MDKVRHMERVLSLQKSLMLYGSSGLDCSILFASSAIYLFPVILPVAETSPLFRIITLLPLYHVQFVSLMSIDQMGSGVLYAILAVPVALIFMGIGTAVSRRVFAKHQIL